MRPAAHDRHGLEAAVRVRGKPGHHVAVVHAPAVLAGEVHGRCCGRRATPPARGARCPPGTRRRGGRRTGTGRASATAAGRAGSRPAPRRRSGRGDGLARASRLEYAAGARARKLDSATHCCSVRQRWPAAARTAVRRGFAERARARALRAAGLRAARGRRDGLGAAYSAAMPSWLIAPGHRRPAPAPGRRWAAGGLRRRRATTPPAAPPPASPRPGADAPPAAGHADHRRRRPPGTSDDGTGTSTARHRAHDRHRPRTEASSTETPGRPRPPARRSSTSGRCRTSA